MKPGIFDLIKTWARKNRQVEICAYLIQNNFGITWTVGDGEFERSAATYYDRWSAVAKEYISNYPGSLEGKTVLEIGPGKSLSACYYLATYGRCKKVYAYDPFCVVDKEIDNKILKDYFTRENPDEIVQFLDEEGLAGLDEKVDYIVSNAVLEHVWDIDALFKNLGKISHENTVMFHHIDFANHNKFANSGELFFLGFSDRVWRLMAGRIGHPNRMMIRDFERLFRDAGFSFEIIRKNEYDSRTVQNALNTYLRKRFTAGDFEGLKIKEAKIFARRNN